MGEVCAECGHPFDTKELPQKGGEDNRRAHTSQGPMHFACYWQVKQKASDAVLRKGTT